MSTGHLFLKPPIGDQKKQGSSEDSKASIDQENSNNSRMSSKTSATLQQENETSKRKTNKGRRGNDFSIVGNEIKANKSGKVGIFGFGNNTHIYKGHHQEKGKQVHSSSGETDSASSSEDDEEVLTN
ncbi:hypothetical protein Pyn_32637 [Prunus yedoensis var. nudiflora]|uniref:Uncharacterized protein n=1 Tax=Prunus yedoensis var. nudiflora TaxID=2094558 RepID=A0A315B1X7_PRUYE|nr:hypothetical protein Pyn_32637 [Prunus yedoensis var. nudiflora]